MPVQQSTEQEYRRAKPIIKLMSKLNLLVFRASGGRLGNKFRRGAPVGLLTSTGRKSGALRTTPLIYLADGENVVLVASQGGLPHHPVWYLNLEKRPDCSFRIGSRERSYRARRVSDAEKAAHWPRLLAIYPDYDDYQKRTPRNIPVLALEPRS